MKNKLLISLAVFITLAFGFVVFRPLFNGSAEAVQHLEHDDFEEYFEIQLNAKERLKVGYGPEHDLLYSKGEFALENPYTLSVTAENSYFAFGKGRSLLSFTGEKEDMHADNLQDWSTAEMREPFGEESPIHMLTYGVLPTDLITPDFLEEHPFVEQVPLTDDYTFLYHLEYR